MTKAELKSAAHRALRLPPDRRGLAEAEMDRLLEPYMERDRRVAENNKAAGSGVLPYVFTADHIAWLQRGVRMGLKI